MCDYMSVHYSCGHRGKTYISENCGWYRTATTFLREGEPECGRVVKYYRTKCAAVRTRSDEWHNLECEGCRRKDEGRAKK